MRKDAVMTPVFREKEERGRMEKGRMIFGETRAQERPGAAAKTCGQEVCRRVDAGRRRGVRVEAFERGANERLNTERRLFLVVLKEHWETRPVNVRMKANVCGDEEGEPRSSNEFCKRAQRGAHGVR